ncbi:hypothetical protein [Candidiatus Paracoxiella cheracis]|uniref:hypothetical protein n=1 Tax=Candidiatus Paracoxiella cheracis TaxID=3405120 RepID=UPI003BF5E2B4
MIIVLTGKGFYLSKVQNTQTLGLGDVLKLVSSDQNLDLTSISNNVIQGIEIIDTTGSGTNELTLDINDVLDISSVELST